MHAISDEIDRLFQESLGDRRMGVEGYAESRWILLDYGDIVIHVFDDETRSYYALEDLWARAKRIPYEPRPSGPASDAAGDWSIFRRKGAVLRIDDRRKHGPVPFPAHAMGLA